MKVKILIASLLIYLATFNIYGQKIDIGIFQHLKPTKIFIEAPSGKYKIKSDGKRVYKLKKDRSIILNYKNGHINISNSKKDFGLHKNIEIIARRYKYNKSHPRLKSRKNSELSIKLISPKHKARTYQGNLKINIQNKELEMVNQVAMPDYLAGVVDAESGPNEVLEYYKNQAVICRTYAIKNSKKHKSEGFHLCDGVHCQAYKGKSVRNQIIAKSVAATKNLVIVDKNKELISALFSANCGGQTNNSEDVWTTPLSYLRSINDKFCTDQRQAFWSKKISVNDWKNFLTSKSINLGSNIKAGDFAFTQDNRKKYYTINSQDLKLTTIRYGLKLRSTFFSITPEGNQLKLSGRGYGHGVGMCQEGAMNMAKKNYTYDKIIKYYYKDVEIIPIKKLAVKTGFE